MNEFTCGICDLTVRNAEFFRQHLEGKAHHKAAAKAEALAELAARSVFLEGKFAIVEFAEKDVVDRLLQQKTLAFKQDVIQVKKRRIDFAQAGSKKKDDEAISRERVLELLHAHETGDFFRDLRLLKAERVEFVARLSAFVQQFFSSEVSIRIFGSTASGFALKDADLDLCFLTAPALHFDQVNSPAVDLMSESIENLRRTKISVVHFLSLMRADQIRLLTRILNEFRKETAAIQHLTAVPDARTPVIRFVTLDDVHCELSTCNALGTCKSDFVHNSLGDGELARLLFLVRLWARSFHLFHDPTEPSGHWTSYSLSLVFLSFCQQQRLIGPLIPVDEREVGGWRVNFRVEHAESPDFEPIAFLKNLLKFMAAVFNQPAVLCIRDGRVYKTDEFKTSPLFLPHEAAFKFSLVNVQDPIELAHNVTANVSKHYLCLLRSRCMSALCHLNRGEGHPLAAVFTTGAAKGSPTSSLAENILFVSVPTPPAMSLDAFAEPEAKRSRADDRRLLNYTATYPTWIGQAEDPPAVTDSVVYQFDGTFDPIRIEMVATREAAGRMRVEMRKSKLFTINDFFHFLSLFLTQHPHLLGGGEEEAMET
ncbi:Speckle targeted PIP5K1A-regulated poly(A) polymerase [Aphelenchoides fujianensis]|nr:Speckle targeted PIP5K1A-regulated poly(A) polymerase [Aphelenchoides fujianensis]